MQTLRELKWLLIALAAAIVVAWLIKAERDQTARNIASDKITADVEARFQSQRKERQESLERMKRLTSCEACDREISRAAKTCPHCGHPR